VVNILSIRHALRNGTIARSTRASQIAQFDGAAARAATYM
jgi:hypothetical protein